MKVKTEFSSCEKTVFELVSRTCLQQVTFVFRREVWKRMNSAQFLTFSRKIKLINYPYPLQSSIVNLLFFHTLFSFSSRESRGFKKLKNGVLNSNSNIKAIRYPPPSHSRNVRRPLSAQNASLLRNVTFKVANSSIDDMQAFHRKLLI